jgi:hypothetical protein
VARSLRLAVAIGLLAALVVASQVVAAGPGRGRPILDANLAGLPTPGLVLAGVPGAGHAWAIRDDDAHLSADGRLDLHVRGLVLTGLLTNPIASGIAIVSCNGGADIVTSDSVPFSVPDGDAHVDQVLDLPASCLAPTVFFGIPATSTAPAKWFAVSGD